MRRHDRSKGRIGRQHARANGGLSRLELANARVNDGLHNVFLKLGIVVTNSRLRDE